MPTKRYYDEQGTLFQQVRYLEEAVAQLQVRTGRRGPQNRRFVCWQGGEEGHIKRDCTRKKATRNKPDTMVPQSMNVLKCQTCMVGWMGWGVY